MPLVPLVDTGNGFIPRDGPDDVPGKASSNILSRTVTLFRGDQCGTVAHFAGVWECVERAGRGGLRTGALAFAIRAGVNFVLAALRFGKVPKEMRYALIRRAIFRKDSFRFAAMLGSFVTLYRVTLDALSIVFPMVPSRLPSPSNENGDGQSTAETPLEISQLSLSKRAQQDNVHETRGWRAAVAGAIAGSIAIMFEKRSLRLIISQQMFVRGLQGSYNAFTSKRGIHIPHGDLLVFCLCCIQIAYALFTRPETLSKSYATQLSQATGAPIMALEMARDINRTGKFDIGSLDKTLAREDLAPGNRSTLLARKALAIATPPDWGPPYPPCGVFHPWTESCWNIPIPRLLTVFRWALPIYGEVQLILLILFKRKAFLSTPLKVLWKATWGTIRKSAFLATYLATFQSWYCFRGHLHELLSRQTGVKIPQTILAFLGSRYSYGFGGLLSALSFFMVEKEGRGELVMHVLPKGLESAWVTAREKGWVPNTGYFGEVILAAVGMGMLMDTYQNKPQHLSGLARRMLYQIVGPN